MTITYSLDVANTRFCGFAKLLMRWKGSIYKILWKEFLVFALGYGALSITYRYYLNDVQKTRFEKVVIFFETFIDLIPLSFVLGFYVSLVIGRWWNQFDCIPWPDRICYLIATYVHGADERSRMIRRTLGRYLILLQALTFQGVSTAFKKRFPTSEHLVAAGIMTKEEMKVYEKVNAPYGKWWLPAQWFSALAMRARKEGRIKDSILLDGLFREFVRYRSDCGSMFNYDWISVPLVYTQVVTLATYTYSVALLVGRQYLDPGRGYPKHDVDMYIPIFTLLQFFFYVGWLKVAEQIVNPYGEDDDDFELNWCMDRNCQIVHLLVDHFHTKHPKLRRDAFWDELLPQLPQTKITAKNVTNAQLGSAFNLEVDPADAEFLPMETLLEEDNEANVYSSDSVKHGGGVRYRPSFLMNILNSGFGQSIRRRSTRNRGSVKEVHPGYTNPSYAPSKGPTPSNSRKSSINKRTSPSHSRASSVSFHPSSISRHRHKQYDLQTTEGVPNGIIPDSDSSSVVAAVAMTRLATAAVVANFEENCAPSQTQEPAASGADPELKVDRDMPPIPEEPSRVASTISIEMEAQNDSEPAPYDDVHNLVLEANKVLEELNKAVTIQGHRHECEIRGYESCCSLSSSDSSDEQDVTDAELDVEDITEDEAVVIDMNKLSNEQHEK